jgi:hypothetical protein
MKFLRAGWDTENHVDPAVILSFFYNRPVSEVTDEMRKSAISLDYRALGHIEPKDTADYLALFRFAFANNPRAIDCLHDDFKTSEAVEVMMPSRQHFHVAYMESAWIAEVMTPAQIDQACLIDFSILLCQPDHLITETVLKSHLEKGYFKYMRLRLEGRLRLAAIFMQTGAWPQNAGSLEPIQDRPNSIEHALALCLADEEQIYVAPYMAWMMIQPIEDVVARITCREHAVLALEMFSADQLLALAGSNRHLKAALLEASLGL